MLLTAPTAPTKAGAAKIEAYALEPAFTVAGAHLSRAPGKWGFRARLIMRHADWAEDVWRCKCKMHPTENAAIKCAEAERARRILAEYEARNLLRF